jgi:hypothetical protein
VSVRRRVINLEQRLRAVQAKRSAVYFIEQKSGETEEEAINRVLAELPPPHPTQFIVAPEMLSLEEWEERYSPK